MKLKLTFKDIISLEKEMVEKFDSYWNSIKSKYKNLSYYKKIKIKNTKFRQWQLSKRWWV